MSAHIQFGFAASALVWLGRLGGPGLILLGIADNSVVPLTGSMDVLTIYLAASHREYWFYYAGMATIGAVIGGYITYRLARKGGKEALETQARAEKRPKSIREVRELGLLGGSRTGSASSSVPHRSLPAVQRRSAKYSRHRFLGALTLGRGLRFTIVAGLGAMYGKHIVGFFSKNYQVGLIHPDWPCRDWLRHRFVSVLALHARKSQVGRGNSGAQGGVKRPSQLLFRV